MFPSKGRPTSAAPLGGGLRPARPAIAGGEARIELGETREIFFRRLEKLQDGTGANDEFRKSDDGDVEEPRVDVVTELARGLTFLDQPTQRGEGALPVPVADPPSPARMGVYHLVDEEAVGGRVLELKMDQLAD